MRSRYRISNPDGIYFLTATTVEWLPIFTRRDAFDIVVEALQFSRQNKALQLYAYVIMENHIHLVANAPDLSSVLRSIKSYTARRLVELASRSKQQWLLNQFAYYKRIQKSESDYQVWQEGFHPQLIFNAAMFDQKVKYVHDNPVRRGYVDVAEHWRYSSARNYLLGDDSVLAIDELY